MLRINTGSVTAKHDYFPSLRSIQNQSSSLEFFYRIRSRSSGKDSLITTTYLKRLHCGWLVTICCCDGILEKSTHYTTEMWRILSICFIFCVRVTSEKRTLFIFRMSLQQIAEVPIISATMQVSGRGENIICKANGNDSILCRCWYKHHHDCMNGRTRVRISVQC